MQELLNAYPIIQQVGPWLGGALGGVLLFVLRNRRPLLTYDVSHTRIGMTADDEIHGKVELTYRGNVVHNLYLSTVTVRNRSIRDLEDLDIKTYRDHENMLLLTEQTAIEGSIDPVNLTKAYVDRITADGEYEQQVREAGTADEPNIKKRLDSDALFRHGQRHYTVPVLNRGQSLRLTYLVHVAPNSFPAIRLVSQSKGVRVKEKPFPQGITHIWGVQVGHAALAGVITSFAIFALVLWTVETLWIAALICLLVGMTTSLPGAILLKTYRWAREKIVG